jgi:hypothetical protein
MLRPLLRALGLTTVGELRLVHDKLHSTRERLDKATAQAAEAAASAERAQQARREDAQRHKAALAQREAEYANRIAESKEALGDALRRVAALEELGRKRDTQFETEMRQQTTLEEQVAAAARDLAIARDSLVAIDVKLDILEGAANVLDARTRKSTA